MQPMEVVPGDPAEDRGARLGAGAVAAAVDQLDLEGGAKNDSATALSRQKPVRPIDWRSPSRSQRSMQAAEVYSLPRMLSCLSSGPGLDVLLGWRLEEVVDLAGHIALEAADDLGLGVALGDAAGDVVLGALVDAHAGDHDQVQRRVGLAVAAPVEPVALGLAGGGGQWRGGAEHRDGGFAAQPLGVVAGGDQQLPGGLHADPGRGHQLRGELADQGGDELVEVGDLVVELQDAAGQRFQRDPGGDHGVAEPGGVGPPGGAGADELHAGEVADLVAQLLGRRDNVVAQQLQRGPAALDRGGAGQPQYPQRFDRAVFGLGGAGAPAGQGGAGGVLGVEGVVLAPAAPVGAVGPVNLGDLDPGLAEVAGDAGAVAAGALDPDQAHVTEAAQPADQGAVAGAGGGERLGPQQHPGGVEHGGDVQVLVGVDPADDNPAGRCDAGHVGLLPARRAGRRAARRRRRTRQ